jgi:hypothetical protein
MTTDAGIDEVFFRTNQSNVSNAMPTPRFPYQETGSMGGKDRTQQPGLAEPPIVGWPPIVTVEKSLLDLMREAYKELNKPVPLGPIAFMWRGYTFNKDGTILGADGLALCDQQADTARAELRRQMFGQPFIDRLTSGIRHDGYGNAHACPHVVTEIPQRAEHPGAGGGAV